MWPAEGDGSVGCVCVVWTVTRVLVCDLDVSRRFKANKRKQKG